MKVVFSRYQFQLARDRHTTSTAPFVLGRPSFPTPRSLSEGTRSFERKFIERPRTSLVLTWKTRREAAGARGGCRTAGTGGDSLERWRRGERTISSRRSCATRRHADRESSADAMFCYRFDTTPSTTIRRSFGTAAGLLRLFSSPLSSPRAFSSSARQLKMTEYASMNTGYSVSVLTTHTVDTQPSLLIAFDNQRYLFNTPEAVSRVALQGKVGLRKVSNVFLGDLEQSAGLPGFILSSVEAGNDKIQVVGPEGTDQLLASCRFFTRR